MNIGISFLPPGGATSAFSSGRAQSSVTLGEVLRQLGHSVTLVSLGKERWFSDCLEAAEDWNVRLLEECVEPFDIFIDMYGNITGSLRRRLGRRVILMMREEMSMALRENVIYENDRRVFSFDNVDCIWTARAEDSELLKVLSKKPVEVIPFYWSPWHLAGAESCGEYDETWRVYIMENNTRINSSCIPSLMICEDLIEGGSVEKIYVLNSERLVESEYFKVNLKKSLTEDYYDFGGRLKTVDIALSERSCVLSHLRFEDSVPKSALLDLVWLGVPVIHNSKWLRDFGHGYEELYYEGGSESSLQGAGSLGRSNALLREVTHRSAREAFEYLCGGWMASADRKVALAQRISCIDSCAWGKALSFTVPLVTANAVRPFIIQFSDFWADFNADYNFFTLLFTEALLSIGDKRKVVGVGEGFAGRASLVVCGPYSERWRQLDPSIPKICFTGELSQPVYGDGIFLNIGFFQNGYGFANTGVNYCRLPLWAASINWFGADNARLVNPTLIDIDECLAEHSDVVEREKFCAFVVSNPSNKVRNEAFQTLNQYKKVDSAGSLFNNMGNGLFAGLGGGGGERRKVEFFRDYKFALVYENSSCSGYTTEKLFHAKVAGCLPLYWGDPTAAQDFNPQGYVNLTNREGDLLSIVRELESDPETLAKMAAQQALTVEKMDELRNVLAMIARYSLDHVLPSEKERWCELPIELGARSTAEAYRLAARRVKIGSEIRGLIVEPEMTEEFGSRVKQMLFITSASEENAGDLYLWLSHMNSIALVTKSEYRLYWTGSVTSRRLKYIKEMYEWINIICVEEFSMPYEGDRLICYMSPCTVLVNNPFYMCAVADKKGICLLKHRDRLVENGDAEPMTDVIIKGRGNSHEVQRIFADNFVGFSSLEESRLSGKAFYCWEKGSFKYKPPFLKGISECSLINLKRRPDRLMRFQKAHGYIKEKIKIVDAIDGRTLRLTPEIARLFKDNTFGWKKGVIGCNLSHLSVWYALAHSNQFIENMLILEDDIKFIDGWEEKLVAAMAHAPDDFDVLYLGGVLPPNKKGWDVCHQPVNNYWARIKENTWFGQEEPTAYFHFCAYSYILSKRGAEKLLAGIERDGGYKLVSDHQILNPGNNMNVYIINPLIAGCYQEEDPIYVNTNFNAINKEHKFDSDLWTNTDCFNVESVNSEEAPLNIEKVISSLHSEDETVNNSETFLCAAVSPPIIFLNDTSKLAFEKEWLQEILEIPETSWDNGIIMNKESTEYIETLLSKDAISQLLVVYREVSEQEVIQLLAMIDLAHKYHKRLIVIHLSDEHRKNDISFYEDPCISLVIRNYIRTNIPSKVRSKVMTLPLGYYRRSTDTVKTLEDRKLLWSFHGTSWFNRKEMIDVLSHVNPHSLHVRNTYEAHGTSREEYLEDIVKSIAVPCPEGNNAESFRIYEALEAGALPLLVDEGRNSEFYLWLQTALPSIIVTRSWKDSLKVFKIYADEPEKIIERRRMLLDEWSRWKSHLRGILKKYIFWA